MACVLRTGAEAELSLKGVVGAISSHSYDMEEPPDRQAPWVDEILMRVSFFRQRLSELEGTAGPYAADVSIGL